MSRLMPALISATGLSELDIQLIVHNAPSRYKKFRVKKRNGDWRVIAQPAREVKALQRALADCCLKHLPVHDAAMAYVPKRSIAHNAEAHANSGPIKKYDFSDFFHSIRSHDWEKYCSEHRIFDSEIDYYISEQLIFQRDKGSRVLKLSIGAPTSPVVSNVLMFNFDTAMSESVAKDKVTYTRYADDLTFSAQRTGYLTAVDRQLRDVVRHIDWPKLTINEKKTVLATKKYRRVVTGIVLANDGGISVGRDRKREIRAGLHRASLRQLPVTELSKLCGILAFVKVVEPDFVKRMEERYGTEVIRYVKAHGSVSRRAPRLSPLPTSQLPDVI